MSQLARTLRIGTSMQQRFSPWPARLQEHLGSDIFFTGCAAKKCQPQACGGGCLDLKVNVRHVVLLTFILGSFISSFPVSSV